MPLLSICIPTFNRSEELKKCLNNIIRQIVDNKFQHLVEIIVTDNASTDDTKAMISRVRESDVILRYHRNQENIGYDRNLDMALGLAQGVYCWTINDNTIIIDSALVKLTGILEDINYAALVLRPYDENAKMILHKNGVEYLEQEGLLGGKLSRCIFRREFLPLDRAKYYENYWFHFSMLLEMIAQKPVAMLHELIIDKPQKSRWAEGGNVLLVFIKLKQIIDNLIILKYPEILIRKYSLDFANHLPRTVASARIHGLKISRANIRLIVNNFYRYPLQLIIAILVMIMPVFLLKLIKKIPHA